jgi:DNA polymerase-3 subunit alpha/error-prone DNA polymerase
MIPLIVRSHYSLMWGTASVDRLCRHAAELGYDRLALTDTDNLYGLWPFLTACRRAEIRPIVGAEVTDRRTRRRAVCLVENGTGYANLCRLLSRRHLDVSFDMETAMPPLARGLTVLTGSPVLVARWHAAGVRVAAAMPRRPLPAGHRLRRTADDLGVPVAAVPGSFFLKPEDAGVHRVLRAIDQNEAPSRLKPGDTATDDAWLADPDTYARRFAPCPEALRATEAIAERLTFSGPEFGLVMPPWQHPDGRDAVWHLRTAAHAGAKQRYGAELSGPVRERLAHELGIIEKMGFSSYFLVVRDIIQKSPRICGRGSGAASLVAYCLGITNVCPLKHSLYFERFLNPGRSDPPDIDIDFAWDERDDVQAAVLENFRGHAAMVANHVCFKPRMAVREVAKVFGLTDAEIGRVSKRMPGFWRRDRTDTGLLDGLRKLPEMRPVSFAPPWPEIMALARRIIGIPRYLSVHSGGVVITPRPIDRYVPVQRAPKGVPVIQWEKDATEDAGLVKIDLLGNRSLGVIRDAVLNVRQNGAVFDESAWEPEDDFSTQEAVGQGRTMGCFYIESPAMRQLQQKAAVGDFAHLVIHSSIIRPAANEFIQEYIRRLHGGTWQPIHPLLSDVLDDTFGIMVYQEDVSRAAVAVAGFSHVEADGLRKIMSKKDKVRQLRDYYDHFRRGARKKGVDTDTIDAIWAMMMSFDGYSFCKPHSASYARVSFQAAYLKVHHPAEFMAAVISNQGGYYSTFAYVSEARRLGLTIGPPDVKASRIRWTGKGNMIRVGLMSIKDLSARTMTRIVEEQRRRSFAHIDDFLQRVQPDSGEGRALVHAGALDRLRPGAARATLLWDLARWEKARVKKVPSLFGDEPLPDTPLLPAETDIARLRREFAVLGFLCDRHPMTLYRSALKKHRTIRAAHLARHLNRQVTMAGWLITGKQVRTKHGDPMEFLTFEDETGIVETTFFPDAYHRYCHLIESGRPYLLTGKVEQNWGVCTLNVRKVAVLPDVPDNGEMICVDR